MTTLAKLMEQAARRQGDRPALSLSGRSVAVRRGRLQPRVRAATVRCQRPKYTTGKALEAVLCDRFPSLSILLAEKVGHT